ncbi:hypothetical protein [Micromonospora sp. NBC_01813]|uniref:hypothetical protein n=1 Tax=Micromonospora sp. NBC_01813 TaxID=2975988 RepID=UPI002DD86463|nr:hypothetical protein [Micromonospora sp. NBC_01813]WSA08164.1 hypothetical protein OG958_28815 [Micromonospora sp. NBC_01813]
MAVALAAEKRLIYIRFLQLARAAFKEARALVASGAALPLDEASLPPLPAGREIRYTGRYEVGTPFALAMDDLSKCSDEVVIVGGREIGTHATAVISAITGYTSHVVDVWDVDQSLAEASTAMHQDATSAGSPDPVARPASAGSSAVGGWWAGVHRLARRGSRSARSAAG